MYCMRLHLIKLYIWLSNLNFEVIHYIHAVDNPSYISNITLFSDSFSCQLVSLASTSGLYCAMRMRKAKYSEVLIDSEVDSCNFTRVT